MYCIALNFDERKLIDFWLDRQNFFAKIIYGIDHRSCQIFENLSIWIILVVSDCCSHALQILSKY